jgi:hypothetical protein
MLIQIGSRMLGHLGPERLLLLRTDGGGTTGMRLGCEGALGLPLLHVPLDARDTDSKGPGYLVFVLLALDGGHDLGPQVRGIGAHAPSSSGSEFTASALKVRGIRYLAGPLNDRVIAAV